MENIKIGDKVCFVCEQVCEDVIPVGYCGVVTGQDGDYFDVDNIDPDCLFYKDALEVIGV